jgi:hypothetical protein
MSALTGLCETAGNFFYQMSLLTGLCETAGNFFYEMLPLWFVETDGIF